MKRKALLLAVALLATLVSTSRSPGSHGQGSAIITLDPDTMYQIINGWEVTDYNGNIDLPEFGIYGFMPPVMVLYKDVLADKAVNDLGINRVRLEVRSGSENPGDYMPAWINGEIPRSGWASHWYEIINDNDDPNVIDFGGFHFTELDYKVDTVVLPLKQQLEARGEQLYVNFCYVGDGERPGMWIHRIPEEYAEFILAVFQHLQGKYGWVPDAVEVSLEPNIFNTFSPTELGNNLVAAANRLQANGFHPDFIAPSHSTLVIALAAFDEMVQNVPGTTQYLTELSYHCYWSGCTDDSLLGEVASRGAQYGIGTSMLEWWVDAQTYNTLHKGLRIGHNSAWQRGVLSDIGDTPTEGATPYRVDITDPSDPQVIMNHGTKYVRQYFKFIRSGAVRIEATTNNSSFDPLAFVNADGKYVVVVKASGGGDLSVQGLPAGTYGIKYTTGYNNSPPIDYDVDLPDATISSGQVLAASIPGRGVITVYAKTLPATTPPNDVVISGTMVGIDNMPYPFTATVSPVTATLPITYVWQATNQSPVTHTIGLSDTVTFSWDVIGTQSITVTAANAGGMATDTHAMAIATSSTPTPPTGVVISGPTAGLVQVGYSFTATVSPVTATLPITDVWQASGQSPVTNTGGLSDTVTFTWSTTGSQAITVTAMNAGGMVTDTHTITVISGHKLYLPLILRSWPALS